VTRRFPTRVSKRQVRNQLAGYAALANGVVPEFEAARRTGPQAEGETNKAIAKWSALKPELFIARNKRRVAVPVGWDHAIELGWLVPGSADWLGWVSVEITPGMVGKRIAAFVGLEAKRPEGGVVSDDQEKFLNRLKDDGGVAGVVRNAEDAERALEVWRGRFR